MSKRRIDGVLLLDKPAGMSSNAALQKVRRALQAALTVDTTALAQQEQARHPNARDLGLRIGAAIEHARQRAIANALRGD